MKIYETNGGLGYNQLAYLIQLNKSGNGYNYLVIGGLNIYHLDSYKIGTVTKDLENIYVEESNYSIKDSPLYGNFLFDFFIENKNI